MGINALSDVYPREDQRPNFEWNKYLPSLAADLPLSISTLNIRHIIFLQGTLRVKLSSKANVLRWNKWSNTRYYTGEDTLPRNICCLMSARRLAVTHRVTHTGFMTSTLTRGQHSTKRVSDFRVMTRNQNKPTQTWLVRNCLGNNIRQTVQEISILWPIIAGVCFTKNTLLILGSNPTMTS